MQVAGKGTAASSSYLSITAAKVDSFSPRLAAAGGMTLLTLTGKGYDGSACDRNTVEVDGVACPVLSCSAGALSVLFPGGWCGGGRRWRLVADRGSMMLPGKPQWLLLCEVLHNVWA